MDGGEVSKHTTEREALESAANHYQDGLEVKVIHDYEVAVVKTASGKIVNVKVRTKKLRLNQPMAIITYTVPGLGATIPDTTPDQFTFVDQVDVALNDVIVSNTITVTGITQPAPISISGTNNPEYQIESESWTNAAGSVSANNTVKVRHTSSGFNGISIDTVLDIGGVADTFTSTTLQGPATSVVWDGLVIPPDSLLYQDGASDNTDLTTGGSATTAETGRTFVLNEFEDFKFRDTSDGSEGIITSNTIAGVLTFSGGLTGGDTNTVSVGHYWEIVTNMGTGDKINFNATSSLGGTVAVSVKGVPSVTGVEGDHTIVYNLEDVSASETSPNYNVVIEL